MAKGLLAILGPPKGEKAEEETESEGSDIEANAMSDFLDAIKAEDTAAMEAAFKRAYAACAAKSEAPDEEY